MNDARLDPRTHRRLGIARRVRDLLRSAIVAGEIDDGVLPGEAELMMSFSTSRQVIRDALGMLRDEGFISRVQGTGTFVVVSKVNQAFTHLHGADVWGIHYRVLDISIHPAMSRVARRLGLEAGNDCAVVEYIAVLDREPYYFATVYMRPSLAAVVERGRAGVADWYGLYEDAGIEIGVTDFTVEATVADSHHASMLNICEGAPLMLFERLIRDANGQPLEYTFARTRGDRIAIQTQLPRRRVRRHRDIESEA